MLLNLDTKFIPYTDQDQIQFEAFTFKGGEPHIKIKTDLSNVEEVTISQRIRSFNDLGMFLLAVDAVQRLGVQTINAVLPYFPAARQDRLMTQGEPFSLKVIANIINTCKLNEVIVYDAHSDVTPAVIDNCFSVTNHKFISAVLDHLNQDITLVSPDGGALKKIYKLAKAIQNIEVIECGKSRDINTGKLSGFKVFTDDLQGKDLLIVDDICDGGGTFIGLAKALKEKNAGKLYLAVSHGIFSKGMETLNLHYDHIFTTDAFSTLESNSQLTQIKLNDGLL